MPLRPFLLQPLLKLACLPDRDVDYFGHVVRRERHPARLLHNDELALRVERDGEQACPQHLFEVRGVEGLVSGMKAKVRQKGVW